MTAPRVWRDRHIQFGSLLIACMVVLLAGSIAGDYFLTLTVATSTTRSIERAKAAAEIKSGLKECYALRGLASIKGSHVSGATYGDNLEAGILAVYEDSGCPDLLKKYGTGRS